MWGCVACNFCVTVCPNDAFFRLPTPEEMDLDGRQQYFVLIELCNECGNCLTFCPEIGDPAEVKPRIYTELSRFESGDRAGFLVAADDGQVKLTAAAGLAGEVARLASIFNAAEGLPLPLASLLETNR
jgi:putative selenate reductase